MHGDLRIGLASRRELAEFSSCGVNAFSWNGNRDFACVGTVRIYSRCNVLELAGNVGNDEELLESI